jgi:glycosyltransferase involved in cell wall biosynthesis
MNTLSLVISVYNEEEVLNEFWNELRVHLLKLALYRSTVIFINDGSKDKSQEIIDRIIEQNTSEIVVKGIQFSTNFGHEAAMIAGIDNTNDDIIICMDSDLQHPPEKISEMLTVYNEGYDIVLMNRVKRHDNSIFMNFFSKTFYRLFEKLSEHKFEKNASDFFLISDNVASVLRESYRERNRFLRGFIQVLGFHRKTIEFEAPARFAGKSNYSFKSLFKLSFTAIFAFSNRPLKISLVFSLIFFFFSILVICYSLFVYFFGEKPPSGYTTLIIFQSIGFTVLSFIISILSIYFGRSLEEIRDRPLYIIKSIKGSKKETIDKE